MNPSTPTVCESSAVAPGAAEHSSWLARLPLICALALGLAHFLWLTAGFAPATMSPDANGYIAQARLLATEGRTSFATRSPVQFVGMHWLETMPGVFHSRYPAGLPVLQAAAWKVAGIRAALLVNPLLASATVLVVFFFARRLAGAWFALLAAATVAAVPVANQHALDADAHIAATFFLVSGVWALLAFEDRRTVGWGLLAGVLLGTVPTIRYPEAIAGVAIAAWLAWRMRPITQAWPAVVGAAIPLVLLCAHNAGAYGAFWRTGYALTNEQTGFGLGYFSEHAIPYLLALSGQGLALMFAFGAAGIAALAVAPRHRAAGVLFAAIVVPLLLLYMAYYFGGGPPGGGGGAVTGNLRFLVPTFPFFAIAGVWLLATIVEPLGIAGRVAVAVVAALQLLIGVGNSVPTVAQTKSALATAAHARVVGEKEIPAGSVVILDRTLAESFDATGRWKLVEESMISGLGGAPGAMGGPGGFGGGARMPGGRGPGRGAATGGRGAREPDAPSPQQIGKNRAQIDRYAGLSALERRERVWADVAQWAAGKPIFWFCRSLDFADNALPDGADYRTVAEVDAPAMTMGGGPGGPMAGAMAGLPGRRGGGGFGPLGPGGNFGPAGAAGGRGLPGLGGRMGGLGAGGDNKLRVLELTLRSS